MTGLGPAGADDLVIPRDFGWTGPEESHRQRLESSGERRGGKPEGRGGYAFRRRAWACRGRAGACRAAALVAAPLRSRGRRAGPSRPAAPRPGPDLPAHAGGRHGGAGAPRAVGLERDRREAASRKARAPPLEGPGRGHGSEPLARGRRPRRPAGRDRLVAEGGAARPPPPAERSWCATPASRWRGSRRPRASSRSRGGCWKDSWKAEVEDGRLELRDAKGEPWLVLGRFDAEMAEEGGRRRVSVRIADAGVGWPDGGLPVKPAYGRGLRSPSTTGG